AHTSFKWANLASHNAGVTVAIISISAQARNPRRIFTLDDQDVTIERQCAYINAYLVSAPNVIVESRSKPLSELDVVERGNDVLDGGNFLLTSDEVKTLELTPHQNKEFIRKVYG